MGASDPWVGTVIDVSKYQTSLPNLAGVLGVIARAGIGTKPDLTFVPHIKEARAAGKWTGSYWYNWGALTPSEQVDAYMAREAEVGGVSLHAIDWEGTEGFTAAETAEFIRIYRARSGEPIGLYASESRFRDLGQDFNWIANYSREPIKQYDMWQYGPFRGVDGNLAMQRILDLVKGADAPMSDIDIAYSPVLVDLPQGIKILNPDGSLRLASNPTLRTAVHSVGLTKSDGGTVMHLVVWTRPDAAGPDLLLAAYQKDVTNVRPIPDDTPIDQATYDAVVKQRDVAIAANATAAARERERIALSLAGDTADKVRNS